MPVSPSPFVIAPSQQGKTKVGRKIDTHIPNIHNKDWNIPGSAASAVC